MKFRLAASAAAVVLIPLGMAFAEDPEPGSEVGVEAPGGDLRAQGEVMVNTIARARGQLLKAVEDARAQEDLLLATCLEDKLEQVAELEDRAAPQLRVLQAPASPEAARVAYVVLTVVGQKAGLVAEEAGQCVGSEQSGGALSFDTLAPPTDPNAGSPPATPVIDHAFPGALPPLPGMPATPSASSPIR